MAIIKDKTMVNLVRMDRRENTSNPFDVAGGGSDS